MMKFVHIADMHFDTSFSQINDANLGVLRRIDQRNTFKKVIDYIIENNVDFLFIAGDLYEHKYVKESTIEFINNQFKRINNTTVFITPGNHDPFIKNSYYNKFKWNSNVHIFGPNITKLQVNDINVYGYGFDDFYYTNPAINSFTIADKNQTNIFITHGSLDAGSDDERLYNPMSSRKIRQLGFDYVALGHIHKSNYTENENVVYPGSTISMGFDEPGKHGMIVGNIDDKIIKTQFITLDDSEFVKEEFDVSNLLSVEDLIENIINHEYDANNYYELYLIGERNFEIDMYSIKKLITNPRIIKIKNKTKISKDYESMINDNTLKGLFIKEIFSRMDSCDANDKVVLEKALEIGLDILDK